MHRLELGLCSHPNEFWGNEVRTHVNSDEDRTHDTASSRTASLIHTTNELYHPPKKKPHKKTTTRKQKHTTKPRTCLYVSVNYTRTKTSMFLRDIRQVHEHREPVAF